MGEVLLPRAPLYTFVSGPESTNRPKNPGQIEPFILVIAATGAVFAKKLPFGSLVSDERR